MVAKHLNDFHASGFQKLDQFREGECPYTLHEFIQMAFRFETDPLEDMRIICKAIYREVYAVSLPFFMGKKRIPYPGAVHEVQDKGATRHQTGMDMSEGVQMVLIILEITEGGKEIEDVMVVVDTEWMSHVVHHEFQMIGLQLGGVPDVGRRNIQTSHSITRLGQQAGMPPTATGQIEHAGTRNRVQVIEECVQETSGLLLIPMLVERVIER